MFGHEPLFVVFVQTAKFEVNRIPPHIKRSRQISLQNSSSILSMIQVVLDHSLFMKVKEISSSFPQPQIKTKLHLWNSRYNVHNVLIQLMKFHSECIATMLFFVSCSLCISSCLQYYSCPLAVYYFSQLEFFLFIQ